MKKRSILVITPLVIFAFFVLVACQSTAYTVSFESSVEVDVEAIENISEGERVELPTLENDTLIFAGWKHNGSIVYGELTVYENVTLEAVWEDPNDVFEYNVTSNDSYPDTVTLTAYTGEAMHLRIPNHIDGLIVRGLASNAFEDSPVQHLEIPVHARIGYRAFQGAEHLTTIHYYGDFYGYGERTIDSEQYYALIDNCQAIDESDYEAEFETGCPIYKTLEQTPEITAPDGTVYYAYKVIVDYRYHELPTYITQSLWSAGSFAYNESLTTIEIPNSVRHVDYLMFYGSPSIESFIISDDHPYLSVIDNVVYNKDQTQLLYYPAAHASVSYTLPQSVEEIAFGAFYDAKLLEEVNVYVDHPEFVSVDGVLYTADNDTLIYYPRNRPNPVYYVLEGTQSILDVAFANTTYLEKVVFPDSVITLGESLFEHGSIQHIVIGESVTQFGSSTFRYLPNIETITFTRPIDSSSDYDSIYPIHFTGFDDGQLTIFVPNESLDLYLESHLLAAFVGEVKPIE